MQLLKVKQLVKGMQLRKEKIGKHNG